MLFLGTYEGESEEKVREYITADFEINNDELKDFKILIAVNESYGYEESHFMLLRHKKTKKLFVNYGSHCSCYGFEGQFDPEEVNKNFLLSDKFDPSICDEPKAVLREIKKIKL